jgi:Domain of unknown function (DUF4399)
MKIVRLLLLAVALACLPCAVLAQGKAPAKDALLYFIWPQNGAVIKGGFWCRFGLRNMGVTHAGEDFQNSGHHRLLIDVNDPLDVNEPIPQDKNHVHFGAGPDRSSHRTAPASTRFSWCWAMRNTIRSIRRSSRKKSRSPSSRILPLRRGQVAAAIPPVRS